MPVVKATMKDIVKAPVGEGTVTYTSYNIRAATEGVNVITAPGSWVQPIVAGVALTPSLDPGPYEVEISIGWFVETYNIIVPDTNVEQQLKTLIDEFIALPPETPAVRLAEAIGSYFAENPVEGAGPTSENVAPTIATAGPTRTAIDARVKAVGDTTYVPSLTPRTSYTWDATTGSIATITEHYDAPIGNRVTTYGAYNSAGDPTTETDPSGQVWILAYDGSGNISTRTKVA